MTKVFLTDEQESEREQFLFDAYASRSEHTGDYWWRMADAISGSGDYTPGKDDGEDPVAYGVHPKFTPQPDGWELTAEIF